MKAQKIKAYPVQISETLDGIFCARGISTFKIVGENLFNMMNKILALTKNNIDKDSLISQFEATEQPAVSNLLKILMERNIIYPIDQESSDSTQHDPEDTFYWHFGRKASTQRKILAEISLLLVGKNATSAHLHSALKISGFENITHIDDCTDYASLEILLEKNNKKYDCVIFVSDFNETARAQYWNTICFKNNWRFMPVILNNLHSYIGPFIIPHDTACYECLMGRENSNSYSVERVQSIPTISGYHPLMPMTSANLAVMELIKIYTKLSSQTLGKLISINFVTHEMKTHKVLRLPRCQLCHTHDD